VPLFFDEGVDNPSGRSFTTLRPAVLAEPGVTGFAETDSFITSNPIGEIPAQSEAPLSEFITELEEIGDVDLLAFGALAVAGTPSTLQTLTWAGEVFDFRELAPIVPIQQTPVTVLADEIQEIPFDSTEVAPGWYSSSLFEEGSGVTVENDVVRTPLGSAILHYLEVPEQYTADELGNMLRQSRLAVSSGSVQLQILLTSGEEEFTFVIGSDELNADSGVFVYEDTWAPFGEVLDAGVPLGDLIEDLRAAGPLDYRAFAISTTNEEGSELAGVTLGTNAFTFAAEAPVVTPPVVEPEVPVEETPGETPVVDEGGENTAPVAANRPTALSNTGSDATVPAMLGGALLLLGGLLLGARTLRRRGTES